MPRRATASSSPPERHGIRPRARPEPPHRERTMLNLRDFIATVERDTPDALVHIDKPVDPAKFEVTAVLQQLEDAGRYPMAMFHQPLNLKGEVSQFPLVTNVFAQRERCAQALGMPTTEAKF